jgi:predicted  nucleic acid-binding Zn-ribbon protein
MGVDNGSDTPPMTRIERVRCLSCGVVYAKPSGGGTVSANPGCPDCGYVGWVLETSPFTRDALQLRSVGDRLRRRAG